MIKESRRWKLATKQCRNFLEPIPLPNRSDIMQRLRIKLHHTEVYPQKFPYELANAWPQWALEDIPAFNKALLECLKVLESLPQADQQKVINTLSEEYCSELGTSVKGQVPKEALLPKQDFAECTACGEQFYPGEPAKKCHQCGLDGELWIESSEEISQPITCWSCGYEYKDIDDQSVGKCPECLTDWLPFGSEDHFDKTNKIIQDRRKAMLDFWPRQAKKWGGACLIVIQNQEKF